MNLGIVMSDMGRVPAVILKALLILFAVGYGGSPDEAGETTLDAMVMDGVCCACMPSGIISLYPYCISKVGSSTNCNFGNFGNFGNR